MTDNKFEYEAEKFLRGKTSAEIVGTILTVLEAHYKRKVENAAAQLSALKKLERAQLENFWSELCKSLPPEEALPIFTNWLESQADGDVL